MTKKSPGSKLLREVVENPKVLNIEDAVNTPEGLSPQNRFVTDNQTDASTLGKGAGGTAYLMFNEDGSLKTTKLLDRRSKTIVTLPGVRSLFHEMIHASHSFLGLLSNNKAKTSSGEEAGDPEIPSAPITEEEVVTRTRENSLFKGSYQRDLNLGARNTTINKSLPRMAPTKLKLIIQDDPVPSLNIKP